MKRLIIISSLLALVLFFSIASLFYLKNSTENTIEQLKTATSQQDVKEILDYWNKEKKKIGLFINGDSVDIVTDSLNNCYSNYKEYDVESEKAVLTLKELFSSQLPTFYNVF